jgi:aminoglycoside phosphotransferase (APT) family kinase protein
VLDPDVVAVAADLGRHATSATRLAGGFSHRTVLARTDEGDLVMRFGGSHAHVEAAVMERAAAMVPVPAVLHRRQPSDGVPGCLVVERVAGVPLGEVLERRDVTDRELADLGRVVGETVGRVSTSSFPRPGFFTDEQLTVARQRPWSEQLPEVAVDAMAHLPAGRLSADEQRRWVRLCEQSAADLRVVDDQSRLVHGDVNPKNILVAGSADGWRVTALLDWEFAYSGCPYADAANMLRFASDYPSAYVRGFREAFAETVADLLPDWEHLGQVLDLFSLSQLLTRPAGHPVADRVLRLVLALVGRRV